MKGQRGQAGRALLVVVGLAASAVGPACAPVGGGVCGSGSWQPGALEIHHLALGQADATLLVGPTGRSLLVDVGEVASATSVERPGHAGADQVGRAIEAILGCRRLDAVLVTHFHLDHVGAVGHGGLWHLVYAQGFAVGQTWHRDLGGRGEAPGAGVGAILVAWRDLLADATGPLRPRPIALGTGQLDLGPGVSIAVVAANGAPAFTPDRVRAGARPQAPPANENDNSVAFVLRFGRFDYWLGGDLSGELFDLTGSRYHDVETAVARGLADVDVYRANHHGSDHSSNPGFLAQIDPEVTIISVGAGNPHGHPGRATLRRLASTGAVYLTSAGAGASVAAGGGDVVVRTDGQGYTVAGDRYLASDPVRIDGDGDGYFREADPDDGDPGAWPSWFGGCDPALQTCAR